jgi:hypothetical protein
MLMRAEPLGWWIVLATLLLMPLCVGIALLHLVRWARHRNAEMKDAFAAAHPELDADEWMHRLPTKSIQGLLVGSLSRFESVVGATLAGACIVLVLLLSGVVLWMLLAA